jgi:drug/metabolite transporter (DMT)-like permease
VSRSYVWGISFLAAVWGASYLFIKVAVEDIEPAPMMFFRTAFAALLLLPVVLARAGVREGLAQVRGAWRTGLALGAVNAAIPFTLIAWGEKHVDSGVAAIVNATVPLFVVLLAIRFRPSERATGARLAGILLGLVGVAVLAGAQPEGGWWAIAGTMAVVLSSISYAVASLYGAARAGQVAAPVLATAGMTGAALLLLPFAIVQFPDAMPGWKAIASVAALTVGGTALAQLVLFRMLRLHGSARTSLVTYLMPPMALLYGALLLDEPITAAAVAGLALILPGVALGSGRLRLGQRASADAPAATATVSAAADVPAATRPGHAEPSAPARPSSAPATASSAKPNTARP